MKINKILLFITATFLIASCTITGRLNKRQYNTALEHSTERQREMVEKSYSEQPKAGFIEYTRADSTKVFIIPSKRDESGEDMMTLDLNEVVVVARSRTLPERMGKVNIDFVVTLPKELQGSSQSIVVTPILHKSDENIELQSLAIRGGMFDKVQQRNYWQLDTYKERFKPTGEKENWAYERFISYPYLEGVRLDSVVENRGELKYFYTQEVKTEEAGSSLRLSLKGHVVALDRSFYKLPLSDTLQYSVSSMLNFVDTTTRYITRIVEKYAVVNDRNYLNFPVNRTDIVDTLGRNKEELDRIEILMDEIIRQKEFHIDSIILSASSSPEGSVSLNEKLSRERAASLHKWLSGKFPSSGLDTLITVQSTPEDWVELERIIREEEHPVKNREDILRLITEKSRNIPDQLEAEIKSKYSADYKYMLENIYPKLRAVTFRYDLRRVGMVKDTIHTTMPDTLYAHGVELLKDRKYQDALDILRGFRDQNTAVCFLSLGYDKDAYEVLSDLPLFSKTEYLKAIACSRLGRKEDALKYFDSACELDDVLLFRGNLDPELSTLIKERENNKKDN